MNNLTDAVLGAYVLGILTPPALVLLIILIGQTKIRLRNRRNNRHPVVITTTQCRKCHRVFSNRKRSVVVRNLKDHMCKDQSTPIPSADLIPQRAPQREPQNKPQRELHN